jgi:cell division protein FtsL
LDDAITSKQKELKLAVSNESRRNIQKELDDLTEKKRVMEIAIKP